MLVSSPVYTDWDYQMMHRCFTLAKRGGKNVKSNPQVGAVISYNGRIIGEGYHHIYGSDHAERDALSTVKAEDIKHLSQSHMFVSLEPCGHQGKTPPCNQAILDLGIPKLTVSTEDPTAKLQGKSISYLSNQGVIVRVGLLAQLGKRLIRPFVCNNIENRPYIILKWAQSRDRYIGQRDKQVWLSNKIAKVHVHQWRTEVDGILIGTNTAMTDDPQLTTRLIKGPSPHRFVLDRSQRLPKSLKLLQDENRTTIVTTVEGYTLSGQSKDTLLVTEEEWNLTGILEKIYERGTSRLMIEGGQAVLNAVIAEGLWDEARIIQTPVMLGAGIKSPNIQGVKDISYNISDNNVLIINKL